MYDFIAIDFETANNYNSSACSIGIAIVKDMKIIETKYFMIKPPDLKSEFHVKNVEIHGITFDMVKNKSKFPSVWNKIKDYFTSENLIVAHNASFDMQILKNCLLEYNIDVPDFRYIDSIYISNYAIENKKISKSLKERCEFFAVEFENHHNALSDSIACANLVIASLLKLNSKSLNEFCCCYKELLIKDFEDLEVREKYIITNHNPLDKDKLSELSNVESTAKELWSLWDSGIHTENGQLKRIERAKEVKTSPVSVDIENKTATFKSSTPGKKYNTSLVKCDCVDFARQKTPCKHIYRLAHELGVINLKDVKTKVIESWELEGYTKKQAIEKLDTFTDEEQEEFRNFVSYFLFGNNGNDFVVYKLSTKSEFVNRLIEVEFAVEKKDVKEKLDLLKKKDLLNALNDEHLKLIKKSILLKDLRKWMLDNIPDVVEDITRDIVLLTYNPKIKDLLHTLHRELARRFPIEYTAYFE